MEDFLKRKLNIDDSVVFIPPYSKTMTLGRVIAFSPKMVRVLYHDWRNREYETSRKPGELVKVDGPDLTMYLLKK
jgi:hypothetical protein